MAQDDESFDLGTVVVSGAKAEVTYKDTPDSVGVLTGESIEELGVTDINDAFELFGNVRKFEGNRGENGIVIRGINSEGVTESFNNAPLTSFIIDGAIQSREATRRGARGLWDVEQVEVFRGPQSTLQGRGSLAGAVIVQTKDPTFDWEAEGRLRFGEFGQREAAAVISGPIVEDTLAFRISAETRRSDGTIQFNDPANNIIGEDTFDQLRAKLLYTPPDVPGLSVKLTFSHTEDKPGVNAVNSDDFFDRVFLTGAASAVEIREATNNNLVLEIAYEFENGNTLTSITSYIDSVTDISTPAGSLFSRVENRGGEDFTQDLRYSFGRVEDTFSGVIGLFYGDFTLPRDSLVTSGAFTVQQLTSNDNTQNFSVYADVRWRFADRWSLLAGGRYTYERVQEISNGVSLGTPISVNSTEEFDIFLPRLGFAYDVTEFQTLSALYSRGYRSGFSEVVAGSVNRIEPEILDSYEISYKAISPDNNWTFAATVFYGEYKDQQIVIPAVLPALPRTQNAGRSELWGAEFEGTYQFANGLNLFGSIGLLQTKFQNFVTSEGNFSGNEFPEAPAVTIGLGAFYSDPSGFFAGVTASYTDNYFATGAINNDPALRVPSFTNVDLQFGYARDQFRARLYVDNLFDTDYVTSLFNTAEGAAPVEATVNDPRRVGFEVSYVF
ncbi:MAG: TonB-dependent receptor [Pseudomonadota bacterium]